MSCVFGQCISSTLSLKSLCRSLWCENHQRIDTNCCAPQMTCEIEMRNTRCLCFHFLLNIFINFRHYWFYDVSSTWYYIPWLQWTLTLNKINIVNNRKGLIVECNLFTYPGVNILSTRIGYVPLACFVELSCSVSCLLILLQLPEAYSLVSFATLHFWYLVQMSPCVP